MKNEEEVKKEVNLKVHEQVEKQVAAKLGQFIVN